MAIGKEEVVPDIISAAGLKYLNFARNYSFQE
jgi:hypothetical protein